MKPYEIGIFVTLLAGCAITGESTRVRMVTDRAAFDLSCDASTLKLIKLSDTSYGVTGCQKKATYVLVDCASGHYQSACKVSLDAVQSEDGSLRPAVDGGAR